MIYKTAKANDLVAEVNLAPMSDHLVRVERLKQLQRERGWTDAELARQAGRQAQQIRAWYAYPASNGRQIGEKLARALEEKLKLPRYSLDERPEAPDTLKVKEGISRYGLETFAEQSSTAREGTRVPVLLWEQLNIMLLQQNSAIGHKVPTLGTFVDVTQSAKFVEMIDDSMEPVFSSGDHILFEPAEVPHAGDTVLVRIATGEHFVRTFRPRTAHHWDAAPINDNYEALSSARDGAEVVAVMVEHRRYRRRR